MKYIMQCLLASLSAMLAVPLAQAQQGTPGIQGVYQGEHLITMRGCPGACVAGSEIVLGRGVALAGWTWNFDEGWAEFQGTMLSVGFRYHVQDLYNLSPDRDIVFFDDNGDGTYTLQHGFQIYNPNVGNPRTETATLFRITQNAERPQEIIIETLDGDGLVNRNAPDGIPGTQIVGVFPMTVQPDFAGRACLVGDARCNQEEPGLWEGAATSIPAIGLLKTAIGDTDSPLKDNWPDTVGTSLSASVAGPWQFTRAETGSMLLADEATDTQSIPDTTLGQPGLVYKYGFALFTLNATGAGAAAHGADAAQAVLAQASTQPATLTLRYQVALPQKLLVYASQRVDGNLRYTLLDDTAWRRVDDHTLQVSVQDNALNDVDAAGGVIHVGIAPVENSVGDYQESSGNGGGALGWLAALGMAGLALGRRAGGRAAGRWRSAR